MSFSFARALIVVCVSLAYLGSAPAQERPPITQVVTIHVKPDRLAEFLAVQTRSAEAARESGRGFRVVWRSNNDTYKFVVVTPVARFADLDSGLGPGSTIPEAEFAALVARIEQTIVSRKVEIRRAVPGAFIWPSAVPRMVHVVEQQVQRAKRPEFEALVRQIAGEYKKVGMPGYGVSQVYFGGSRTTYVVWRPVEEMAEFDSPGWFAKASKAMGEEAGNQWRDRYRSTFSGTNENQEIHTYQESLSYYPDQE